MTTTPYSLGTGPEGSLPSPYTVNAGSVGVKFVATAEPTGATAFEGFDNMVSPATGLGFDYADGTHLLDTFDTVTMNPTGPLEIDFSKPVGSFGFKTEDAAADQEQFTFTIYNPSGTVLSVFTTPVYDNTSQTGKSVFLGAASDSLDISKVVISSFSDAGPLDPNGNSNDFYTGPVTVGGTAVPEPSTLTTFGLAALLLGGLAWGAHTRKKQTPSVVD